MRSIFSLKSFLSPSLLALLLLIVGCAESSSELSKTASTASRDRAPARESSFNDRESIAEASSRDRASSAQASSDDRTPVTQALATQQITYSCESDQAIEVSYFNNDTVTVDYAGEVRQLSQTISGSGDRYAGDGVVWWTKGQSGTLYSQENGNSPETEIESCTEETGVDSVDIEATPTPSFSTTINPSSHVGPITRETSEDDLIEQFGAENIESITIPIGEGETVAGTRLFGGTPNAVDIEWKDTNQWPKRITIHSGATNWKTQEGLSIGSSLADVAEMNGQSFELTGFEWDYPGRSLDWQGGVLSQSLQVDFRPTQPSATNKTPLGPGPYSSQDESIQDMALVIERISIRWDGDE